MIAKLELHKVMLNKQKTNTEFPQTKGSTLNNRSTEQPPQNGQQPKPLGA